MKNDDDMNFKDFVLTSYGKHFDNETFLDKLKKMARRASSEIIYKALVLYHILLEEKVPFRAKALIIGGLGYLILPTDLVPDFIVGLGFTDDLAAITFVLSQIEEYKSSSIEEKSKKMFKDVFEEPYSE